MIKNSTKLLVANWILCLIVSFISSANASELKKETADDSVSSTVMAFSGGSALTTHKEHGPRLAPLTVLKSEDSVAWHENLAKIGYLKSNSTVAKISAVFYTNYGSLRGKDNEQEAALASWVACDKVFDKDIIVNVRSYIEREGVLLTPAQIETIRDRLNPSRGTVRSSGTTNRFQIITLDKARLFKLHLKTILSSDISSEWTCYRYTARMTADLDIGIYEFLK